MFIYGRADISVHCYRGDRLHDPGIEYRRKVIKSINSNNHKIKRYINVMRDQNNSCLTINFKMNQTKHLFLHKYFQGYKLFCV